MAISLLLILYGGLVTYLTGFHLWKLLQRWLVAGTSFSPFPALFPFVGMAGIGLLISILHFFIPIGFPVHIPILIWATYSFYQYPKSLIQFYQAIRNQLPLLILMLLGAVLSIISRPGSGDIADYHLQAIKWAENFQNITGLGNFNRPLANNNWWFNLQAFLGVSWAGVKSVYVGNALYFLFAFCWFYCSPAYSNPHKWLRLIFLSFIILSFKTAFIGAVTPDIIVTLTFFILVDLSIISIEENSQWKGILLLSVLLVSWILTVKATSVLFGLFCIPGVIRAFKERDLKLIAGIAGLGLLFMVPWFTGNILVSGYLLYPFNQINLFNVDWKVPAGFFEFDKVVLRSWGKIPGQDIYLTDKLTFVQWFPVWFGKLDVLNKGLVSATVFSLPYLLFQSIKQKHLVLPVAVILAGGTAIFLNGPHPRFLFPYYVSTIALAVYAGSNKLKLNLSNRVVAALSVVGFCTLFLKPDLLSDIKTGLVNPRPYPQNEKEMEVKTLGHFTYYRTTQANTCWDVFPSTYYYIDSVELRTQRVEDGFRIRTSGSLK